LLQWLSTMPSGSSSYQVSIENFLIQAKAGFPPGKRSAGLARLSPLPKVEMERNWQDWAERPDARQMWPAVCVWSGAGSGVAPLQKWERDWVEMAVSPHTCVGDTVARTGNLPVGVANHPAPQSLTHPL
jgi:hypothetical protein